MRKTRSNFGPCYAIYYTLKGKKNKKMEKIIKQLENIFFQQVKLKKITNKNRINKSLQIMKTKAENYDFHFDTAVRWRRIITGSLSKKKYNMGIFTDPLIAEHIFSRYITYNIPYMYANRYPNYVQMLDDMLNYLDSIKNEEQFTAIRFDFVKSYSTMSKEYVYNKLIKQQQLKDFDRALLEAYCKQIPYCQKGLAPDNEFVIIMHNAFYDELTKELNKYGKAKCYHFGDDFVAFVNKNFEKEEMLEIVQSVVKKVYRDESIECSHKNKSSIHTDGEKFQCFNINEKINFNFLGYDFNMFKNDKNEIDYKFGPIIQRINKAKERIFSYVLENYKDVERTRKYLYLCTKPIIVKNVLKNLKVTYNCSYTLINYKSWVINRFDKFNDNFVDFMKNVVFDAFTEQNLPLPYYLKGSEKNNCGYTHYYCLKNSKIIPLKRASFSKEKLIGYVKYFSDANLSELDYDSLIKILRKNYHV